MKTFKEYINETSLSRVWQHFKSDKVIVIMTAFRDENDRRTNIKNNKTIAAKLKNAGFGYFYVNGFFPENEGTDAEVEVKEDSIFAIAHKNDGQKLIDTAHNLANEFNQDSIIVKDSDGSIYFLDQSKSKYNLEKGKMTPGKIGKFYTQLRNKKVTNTFVFEGAGTGKGYFQRHRESLNESSLSRVWTHNENHDCGALTAFRKFKDCEEKGEEYTSKENKQRNKSLLLKLQAKGYSVTKLKGKYPEGGETKKESSYWVVDINDKGTLEKDLRELGEYFDQDSILYVPKGSIKGDDKAYLIGTNRCTDNWLGYGGKELFSKGKLGYESDIYTSYVNGRPFIFEDVDGVDEVLVAGNGLGYLANVRVAQRDWWNIDV